MTIAVIVFLVFLLICARSLKKGIALFAALVFFTPKAFILLDIKSIPVITLNRALVAALLISLALQLIAKKKVALSPKAPGLMTAILLTAVMLASSILAEVSRDGAIITSVSFLVENFLPAAIIFSYNSEQLSKKIILVFLIAAGISITYTITTYILDINPFTELVKSTTITGRVEASTYEEDLRGKRALGTFSHPITLGGFMCFVLFAAIISKIRSPLKCTIAASALIVIYLTNSRSPLIFLLAWYLSFLFLTNIKIKLKATAMMLAGLLFLCVALPEQASKTANSLMEIASPEKTQSMHGSSLEMRAVQFAISYSYLLKSPLIGNGANTTREIVSAKTEKELYNSESAIFPLMIDTGILGVIFFLSIFISLLAASRQISREKKHIVQSFILGYLAFILATGIMDTLQTFLILIYSSIYAFPATRASAPLINANVKSQHDLSFTPPKT